MTSNYPKRVIRAALYDALQAAALAFGGIGSGTMYTEEASAYDIHDSEAKTPHCIVGFLHFLGAVTTPRGLLFDSEQPREILGFGWGANDGGVAEIRAALGLRTEPNALSSDRPRVPFDAWVEYFNIQRAVELPAKVYDALKASAEKYGGLGKVSIFGRDNAPVCFIGHAHAAGLLGNIPLIGTYDEDGYADPDTTSLYDAAEALAGTQFGGLTWSHNDNAVRAINERKGVALSDRVTFEEWANELNVIRVVQLAADAYDKLKASAEKHGGIGADSFDTPKYDGDFGGYDPQNYIPYCVAGHAALIDSDGYETVPNGAEPTLLALQKAFNLERHYQVYDTNDAAVHAINQRKGVDEATRVTFEEWAKELNVDRVVVRGAV